MTLLRLIGIIFDVKNPNFLIIVPRIYDKEIRLNITYDGLVVNFFYLQICDNDNAISMSVIKLW